MTKPLKIALCATALLTTAATSWAEKPSPFKEDTKVHTARVSILAVSAQTHQNYAGNTEVYLADITIGKKGHQFVKLVDLYPRYATPIRTSVLRDRTVLSMHLTRNSTCDTPAGKIYLPRTDQDVFDGSVRDTLAEHPNDLIPCYNIEHEATRFVKK